MCCVTDVVGSLHRHSVAVANQELDHAFLSHTPSKQFVTVTGTVNLCALFEVSLSTFCLLLRCFSCDIMWF